MIKDWIPVIIGMVAVVILGIGAVIAYIKIYTAMHEEREEIDETLDFSPKKEEKNFKKVKYVRDIETNERHKVAQPKEIFGVYFVYEGNVEDPKALISVTSSEEEAYLVADRFIYHKYFKKFKKWCSAHNASVDNLDDWETYCDITFGENQRNQADGGKETFAITRTYYTQGEIASALRMIMGCKPMGLPFEMPEEKEYYDIIFKSENTQKKSQKNREKN